VVLCHGGILLHWSNLFHSWLLLYWIGSSGGGSGRGGGGGDDGSAAYLTFVSRYVLY